VDKQMTADDVVAQLRDGMTIGIGGWGSRRKPMALVRAILRSDLRDLTLVSYGGPDVGLLCASGRVRKLVYGFVSLDSIPLEPHFRTARETAAVDVLELDEGMLQAGLRAAAHRLPFQPIRAGVASAVMETAGGKDLRTVRSPYDDGEELVAMPALHLDAALVHLNRADRHGNAQYLGPDPYFDDLFCLAATHRFLSCEQVVDTAALTREAPPQSLLLNRMMVDGVVETPRGAHFTSCVPDYGRDEAFQGAYARAAADADAWASFEQRFLSGTEQDYHEAVRAFAAETEQTDGAAR
jgi:glutaconate CoA-transferase, subunit A